jgi:hypothetical protein
MVLCGLALGELEVGTGAFLPVLFALFGPGIAANEPGFLQWRPQVGVKFDQRPCDAVSDRTGLAHDTPAETFTLISNLSWVLVNLSGWEIMVLAV